MPALAQPQLLLCVLLVVIGLILLITRLRVPAFIALLVASLAVGAGAGLSVGQVCKAFQEGVGAVLGSIAVIIGLGAVLGKLLAESGGAQQIAQRLLALLGARHLPWTMLILGFVVGIPVFFSVGLVLLAPILYAVRDKSNVPFLHLAIPLLAGLSAAHGLVPPHPGPMAAIEFLKADVGKTVFYSLLIGAGAAVVSGPLLCRVWGSWKASTVSGARSETMNPPLTPPRRGTERRTRDDSSPPGRGQGWVGSWSEIQPTGTLAKQFAASLEQKNLPPFWPTLFTVLLPVLLMLLATGADLLLAPGHLVRKVADALGTPLCAMLIAVIVAFRVLGTARGFDRATILKFTEDCIGPIASILLVVGAGGGFNKVLIAGGVGDAIVEFARHAPVSPLILGWLIAALIRVATGSATVAITTAAGIVAPLAAATPGVHPELLVIAMGAGSLILSHVNDGGFWLVKEYLGLSVGETLKSWTVMETVLSVTTLGLVLIVNALAH